MCKCEVLLNLLQLSAEGSQIILKINLKTKLKIMEKVYWTMKNGQQIDVDQMEINHLRNTLKMIIRNQNKVVTKPKTKFQINGEIAQSIIDDGMLAYYEYEMGIDDEYYYDHGII